MFEDDATTNGGRPDSFIRPDPVSPGDTVAIIAPSSGLAALFPDVLDLALDRLRDIFDLNPVIYPTAEQDPDYLSKHPEERARDIHDAFRDPEVSAVFATVGGADQIKILKHLDSDVLRANPTRFFGGSDNACLTSYLWTCGMISYYGGSLLSDIATPGGFPEYTQRYLQRALFDETIGEFDPAEKWTDDPIDWASDDYATTVPKFENNPGRQWAAPSDEPIEGRLWGGCLSVLHALLAGDRAVPSPEAIDGDVLAIETAETMPSADEVGLMLASMGERGLLEGFDAVLIGRPQTRSHDCIPSEEARRTYRDQQWATIKTVFHEYNPEGVAVNGLDFGHTNPIAPIPIGDFVRVDPGGESVTFME